MNVHPIDETLELAEADINAKEKADDQRLDRAQKKGLRRETIVGLVTGIILVLLGGWLFISGFEPLNGWAILIGLTMLAFGLTSTEAANTRTMIPRFLAQLHQRNGLLSSMDPECFGRFWF